MPVPLLSEDAPLLPLVCPKSLVKGQLRSEASTLAAQCYLLAFPAPSQTPELVPISLYHISLYCGHLFDSLIPFWTLSIGLSAQ